MKTTVVCMLVFLIISNLQGRAQQVTFTGNDIRLESFFSAVTKQTGYVCGWYLKNIPE